ncbi:MAG: NifU family protein [Campylobacterales bacterium]
MNDAFQQGLQAYLKKQYDVALSFWIPAAEAGDASAATNLGLMHLKGEGVAKNPAEAARLFAVGAQAGNASAVYNLAGLYENGLGVETSLERAIALYEQAAASGHSGAAYQLGTIALELQNDKARGIAHLVDAVDAGHPRAKMRLAIFNDEMLKADPATALNTDFRALGEAAQRAVVESVLEQSIRATLQKDGGDVKLGGLRQKQPGVVDIYLCYEGACVGCSLSSTATLSFIRDQLTRAIDPAIRVFAL